MNRMGYTQKTVVIVALLAFTLGGVAGALLRRPAGALVRALPARLGLEQASTTPTTAAPPIPTAVPAVIPAAYQGRLRLFLLAGQSNMSGYSSLPERQSSPHPRILVFGNDYRWRLGTEPVDAATGQVDPVSEDRDAGFGPSMAFARALVAAQPDAAIGLIPCAKGNTTIADWARNLSEDTLSGSCLKRARAASPMGEIAGLLFFQGESDAADPLRYPGRARTAAGYAAAFAAFVEALRADLGEPLLPVVFAQIGSHQAPQAYTEWATVQAEQASVALPCVAMIITADLPLHDAEHYTPEAYETIGERFAEALLRVEQEQGCGGSSAQ